MKKITCEEALQLITGGFPIENCIVTDKLDIRQLGNQVEPDIIMKDSVIDFLDSPSVEFKGRAIIENCSIVKSVFNYAYFVKGIALRKCIFESYVDFEAGGHNENGGFVLEDNSFKGFVNFFDCWFMGAVIVKGNTFESGSNLLGNKGESYEPIFDGVTIIENNAGRMDCDGEGDKQTNVIYFNPETGEGFNAFQ
jgi:hypothetical protein